MSIDEMSSTLKLLGEKLKNKTSVSTSIESIKSLSGYYEHQQEQLKGFEKDPKKLQENLAIMDSWINSIKSLLNILR
jgi:hypothetical protein